MDMEDVVDAIRDIERSVEGANLIARSTAAAVADEVAALRRLLRWLMFLTVVSLLAQVASCLKP